MKYNLKEYQKSYNEFHRYPPISKKAIPLSYLKLLAKKQFLKINSKKEFESQIDWVYLSYQKLSSEFIDAYYDRLDLRALFLYQTLSNGIILKYFSAANCGLKFWHQFQKTNNYKKLTSDQKLRFTYYVIGEYFQKLAILFLFIRIIF
jgi:hypothetical protein